MNAAARLQTFEYQLDDGGTIWWDVTHAEQLIARRHRARVAIDQTEMQHIRDKNEWDAETVAQADPKRPGIAAPMIHEGEIVYILIDGTHRCVRALELGMLFEADLLTDEDSRACVIEAPAGRIP